MNKTFVKAGAIVVVTQGEYDRFCLQTVGIANKDFFVEDIVWEFEHEPNLISFNQACTERDNAKTPTEETILQAKVESLHDKVYWDWSEWLVNVKGYITKVSFNNLHMHE